METNETKCAKIFVASKGRPDGKTFSQLKHLTIVVEPQDAEAYATAAQATGHTVVVLPENNRGIGYVRQFILDRARQEKLEWFWMLDDDISGFYRQEDGRNKKTGGAELLALAEQLLTNTPDLAQGALEYQQYAFRAKKDLVLDTFCDVAVFINVNRTANINYRAEVNLKEDRDFTMQCIADGWRTARTARLSFAAPKNGSNKGGLYDEYKANREKNCSDRMVALWPGIATFHEKPDGRPDVKINWEALATRRDAGKQTIAVHCLHDRMEDPAALQLYPDNPNQHPENQIKLLADIIRANGWRKSVVVSTRSKRVTKGHGRILAAKRLGCRVPVTFQDYPDENAERQDLLADNRLFEIGETDDLAVASAIAKLNSTGTTLPTGYTDGEIERLMAKLNGTTAPPAVGADAPPAPQAERNVRTIVLHYTTDEHEEFESRALEAIRNGEAKTQSELIAKLLERT
jgi:ParB-like chromosome segregation protein Spo0J